MNEVKILGIVVMIILILNLILFSFTIISSKIFWGIIIVGAIIAFKGIPYLKRIRH